VVSWLNSIAKRVGLLFLRQTSVSEERVAGNLGMIVAEVVTVAALTENGVVVIEAAIGGPTVSAEVVTEKDSEMTIMMTEEIDMVTKEVVVAMEDGVVAEVAGAVVGDMVPRGTATVQTMMMTGMTMMIPGLAITIGGTVTDKVQLAQWFMLMPWTRPILLHFIFSNVLVIVSCMLLPHRRNCFEL